MAGKITLTASAGRLWLVWHCNCHMWPRDHGVGGSARGRARSQSEMKLTPPPPTPTGS